jgi:hypothetical protein
VTLTNYDLAGRIDKGLAGPGLLAYVAVSKLADHLPLYRLEQIFARQEIAIARSTMCGWMDSMAKIVKPLYDLMTARVKQSKVVQTDETRVPLLPQVPTKGKKCKSGRIWCALGDVSNPYDVYSYTPDADVVAVSPSSVHRVLKAAGRIEAFNGSPSKKGMGFAHPLRPHEHWHVDVSYANVSDTFYYLASLLDGYSRSIVHFEIHESMTADRVADPTCTREVPGVTPRIIFDNGPQIIAKDFKHFTRLCGMLDVAQAFGTVAEMLETIFQVTRPVDTLERGSRQMAEAAPAFRAAQPAPDPKAEGDLLLPAKITKAFPWFGPPKARGVITGLRRMGTEHELSGARATRLRKLCGFLDLRAGIQCRPFPPKRGQHRLPQHVRSILSVQKCLSRGDTDSAGRNNPVQQVHK